MRRETAEASGSSISRSAISPGIASPGRDAAALEEGDEEDPHWGEVEDVLRAGVRRPPHLHHLEGAQEVAAALQVRHDEDSVRDGLLHAEEGGAVRARRDLGDKEG